MGYTDEELRELMSQMDQHDPADAPKHEDDYSGENTESDKEE